MEQQKPTSFRNPEEWVNAPEFTWEQAYTGREKEAGLVDVWDSEEYPLLRRLTEKQLDQTPEAGLLVDLLRHTAAKSGTQLGPDDFEALESELNEHLRSTNQPYFLAVESAEERPRSRFGLSPRRPVATRHALAPVEAVSLSDEGHVTLFVRARDGSIGYVDDPQCLGAGDTLFRALPPAKTVETAA